MKCKDISGWQKTRPTWRNACQGKEAKYAQGDRKRDPLQNTLEDDKNAVILMERSDRRISLLTLSRHSGGTNEVSDEESRFLNFSVIPDLIRNLVFVFSLSSHTPFSSPKASTCFRVSNFSAFGVNLDKEIKK